MQTITDTPGKATCICSKITRGFEEPKGIELPSAAFGTNFTVAAIEEGNGMTCLRHT